MIHWSINFPNMGIHLKYVGKAFTILGFDITYYGILIGLAILTGVFMVVLRAKHSRQKMLHYLDFSIIAVIAGVIGARLFYVVFNADNYKGHFLSIFNLREGGFAIYGAILAGILAAFLFGKIRGIPAYRILDTVWPAILTGQIIGRFGDYFNREGFGDYTNGLFAMQLPIDSVRSADITEAMREHLVRLDGVNYIQVHPAFLYEIIWCLIVLAALIVYKKKRRFEGEMFLAYLFAYALGRMWIELFRTDSLRLLGMPVSTVVSVILLIVTGLLIARGRMEAERRKKARLRRERRLHEQEMNG